MSLSLIFALVPWTIDLMPWMSHNFLTTNYIRRIAHVTGELRRSPVYPPVYSRVTSEVRAPVAEDFVQLGLENLQEWRLQSIFVQTINLFSEIKFSLDSA